MIRKARSGQQLVAGLAVALLGLVPQFAQAQLNEQEIREIGTEAYLYFYPLVHGDLARRQATNVDTVDKPGFFPANTFQHAACFQDVPLKDGERPNLDALPSSAWLNVSREPIIVSVPQSADRYYFLSFFNHWSEIFLSLGSRTLGGRPGHFALVPAGWKGALPKDVERIDSPSMHVRVAAYTQAKGEKDCAAANAVQAGYRITPLSLWNKQPPKPGKFKPDPAIDMTTPVADQIAAMPVADYFRVALDTIKFKALNLTDSTMLMRMKKIGIDPTVRFDFQKLDAGVRVALLEVPSIATRQIQWQRNVPVQAGRGWVMPAVTQGVYGNAYLKRAGATAGDNAATPFVEAIYLTASLDTEGLALKGDKKYTMRFKKGELPPASAYWSLTMHDETGKVISNSINRTNINAETPLKLETDGSAIVHIQSFSPGAAWEGNWLPAPKGAFALVLRIFGPQPEALEGVWTPPSVERVKSGFSFSD
ncbi:MAG: DUF1254 domain-containing protein [Dechloromonas sp.]|nr:MAG: DUF1254 domain-containing protein [Dechloromonas sp.]